MTAHFTTNTPYLVFRTAQQNAADKRCNAASLTRHTTREKASKEGGVLLEASPAALLSGLSNMRRAELVELYNLLSDRPLVKFATVEDGQARVYGQLRRAVWPDAPATLTDLAATGAAKNAPADPPQVSTPVTPILEETAVPTKTKTTRVRKQDPITTERAPRTPPLLDIQPSKSKSEIHAFRDTSMLAWLLDKLSRKNGVTESEIQAELTARELSNPPRTWLRADFARMTGYGVTESAEARGRFFLVLPKGMDAPLPHRKAGGE
jgi:hypothetical protein